MSFRNMDNSHLRFIPNILKRRNIRVGIVSKRGLEPVIIISIMQGLMDIVILDIENGFYFKVPLMIVSSTKIECSNTMPQRGNGSEYLLPNCNMCGRKHE